jgi:hypothetical protein
VNALINKNYEIEHYQKLTNIISKKKNDLDLSDFKKWIKQTYSNRIFIIDEVHNLKLDEQEDKIKRYDAVKLIIKNADNLKLVLLSGTPMGHSVKEIIDLLNLLLINDNQPEIRQNDIFKKNLDFTNNGIELLNKLSKSYISFITNMNKNKVIYDIPFQNFAEENLENLSTKLYQLLQNIKKSKGTVFIYTNFIHTGVLMVASMLLKNGISLNNSRKNSINEILLGKKSPMKRSNPMKKNQLCAICNQKNNDNHDNTHKFIPMVFDYIIGQTIDEIQKKIITKFNHPNNTNGEKLKIIIGSSVLKEGVSFQRVQQLHILDPWHNKSRMEQIIARAIRHCSHKSLSKNNRIVEINLYCAILNHKYPNINDEIINKINNIFIIDDSNRVKVDIDFAKFVDDEPLLSYDMIMYKRSELSNYYISKVENILKSNAFDNALNRNLNNINEKYNLNGFDDNFDFDLDELDISTYNNIFLTPYIQYVIRVINKHFINHKMLTFNDFIKFDSLQDDIYQSNDFYIIKKSLNTIVPIENNLKNFPYIIKHININNQITHGYIMKRKSNDDYLYFFQEFDEKNKYVRSNFEQTPIYENHFDIIQKNVSFENFLIDLKKKDYIKQNKKIDNVEYNNILKKIYQKKRNVGSEANKIIRENFDVNLNYGNIVGITIDKFKDELWIRHTNDQTKVGRRCLISINRTGNGATIENILKNLYPKTNADFQTENNTEYKNLILNNKKKKILKKHLCSFITKILNHLNDQKFDNKVWLKNIK